MMEETKKLTEEEFVVQAIKNLRKEPFRGIHTVYSGFNEAFRKYFGTNPVEATDNWRRNVRSRQGLLRAERCSFFPGRRRKRPTTEEIIQLISGSAGQSISQEEFIIEGIKKLRKDPYRGINSVFSGLNEAFRRHFSTDPIEFTGKLAGGGKIEVIPQRGGKGVMLYLPGEGPRGRKTDEALRKILG